MPSKSLKTSLLFLLLSCCAAQLQAQDNEPRPPAATLSAPDGATMKPDEQGFIRRWLVLEPIPVSGRLNDSAVNETIFLPQYESLRTAMPADGESISIDGENLQWHALDTSLYNLNLYHFAWPMHKPTSNVLFWAITVIDSPQEMQNVRLAIGSNAASIWWLNGERVISLYNDRQTVIDDGVSDRLTLKKGRNIIRAAIINAGGATDFAARLLDGNYQPLTSITVDLRQ